MLVSAFLFPDSKLTKAAAVRVFTRTTQSSFRLELVCFFHPFLNRLPRMSR